jgi:alpha-tubulin suppressor-like RCC1 family protein
MRILLTSLLLVALGCTDTSKTSVPTLPDAGNETGDPAPVTWLSISAGSHLTCGINPDNQITCWSNFDHPSLDPYWSSETPSGEFTSVHAGGNHSCGLSIEGEAICWGDSESLADYPTPEVSFSSITTGKRGHSCGVPSGGGEALCWGSGGNEASPVVVGSGIDFRMMSAGGLFTCAITGGGYDGLHCWGVNWADTDGQLSPPSGKYSTVSVGESHSCALTKEKEVRCWGSDEYGQSSPPVESLSLVSSGWQHSCGLTEAKEAICWGSDEYGQSTPPEGSFVTISAGDKHTCALNINGEAICWGLYPEPSDT